jgi:hypothetical protein
MSQMSQKTNTSVTKAAVQRQRPVRVKLRRLNANICQAYPPDGEKKLWWNRLGKALGTVSSGFVNAAIVQLQHAAQLHCGGISDLAINAAFAMIEAAAPQNEMEAALAIQMACTHTAAMSVLARFGSGGGTERRVVPLANAAARLMRAYSAQVETLRRLRHGGDQYVRVEHVYVAEGGQALIGNVKARDRDQGQPDAEQPRAQDHPVTEDGIEAPIRVPARRKRVS